MVVSTIIWTKITTLPTGYQECFQVLVDGTIYASARNQIYKRNPVNGTWTSTRPISPNIQPVLFFNFDISTSILSASVRSVTPTQVSNGSTTYYWCLDGSNWLRYNKSPYDITTYTDRYSRYVVGAYKMNPLSFVECGYLKNSGAHVIAVYDPSNQGTFLTGGNSFVENGYIRYNSWVDDKSIYTSDTNGNIYISNSNDATSTVKWNINPVPVGNRNQLLGYNTTSQFPVFNGNYGNFTYIIAGNDSKNNLMYLTSAGLFSTTDKGTTWKSYNLPGGTFVKDFTINRGLIYVVTSTNDIYTTPFYIKYELPPTMPYTTTNNNILWILFIIIFILLHRKR